MDFIVSDRQSIEHGLVVMTPYIVISIRAIPEHKNPVSVAGQDSRMPSTSLSTTPSRATILNCRARSS